MTTTPENQAKANNDEHSQSQSESTTYDDEYFRRTFGEGFSMKNRLDKM